MPLYTPGGWAVQPLLDLCMSMIRAKDECMCCMWEGPGCMCVALVCMAW